MSDPGEAWRNLSYAQIVEIGDALANVIAKWMETEEELSEQQIYNLAEWLHDMAEEIERRRHEYDRASDLSH